MTEGPNPFMDGDKFPGRPDHPDFWRLSEIILKLDGRVNDPRVRAARNVKGGAGKHTAVEDFFDRIADGETIGYVGKQRVLRAVQMYQNGVLGTGGERDLVMLLQSIWLEGFMIGAHYMEAGGHRDKY